MNISKKTVISVLAISLSISVAVLIISISFAVKAKKSEPTKWVLHSYGNNVALYNGEKIIEVYGTIMLDTLPPEDRRLLDNGIVFSTKAEAVLAIEDYDG
jgi:hypothetical protein